MGKTGLNEIRKEYLDFFESKDHIRLKSYSLIPEKDKSLLLINAGMAPLKDYFIGNKKMSKDRATSSQRCLRTADIDNVGKTHRHATFFEMLGNFSFGDYFKREAINWAWEFLTEKMGIDKDRLFVTVYKEDDEAYNIWKDEIGLSEDKILRLGKEDNFWELEEGPCGPCSEIHYDRGDKYLDEDDRYMEIWNLVFTQFNKDKEGNYHPLAHPNIDTGMGLERIALVMEDAQNIFELEAFKPIMEKVEEISGHKYGESDRVDESIRVIMDHAKAMTFLVYDGVIPSNEGRGYVLRRLIRRAYRHGKLLGIDRAFLTDIIDVVMDVYRPEYPELEESKDRIFKIVRQEEAKFQETIDQGLNILSSFISKLKDAEKKVLSGEKAFKLYDTYGFPLDLTKEILKEESLDVDEEEFNENMIEQKNKSRQARHVDSGWDEEISLDLSDLKETEFVGYDHVVSESKIVKIFKSNESVDEIRKDDKAIVILDKTPFYAESGGQIGDTGFISGDNYKLKVIDTQKTPDQVFYHIVEVLEGSLKVDEDALAEIDYVRRKNIIKNHSATHVLHKALKLVLGDHINQAGSLVTDERLRFDFTHFEAISNEDLRRIEEIANREIFLGSDVDVLYMSLKESQDFGAIGLFEDKYQDEVRVVKMGDFSTELCGGCHVDNTSDIQMLKIVSESGIAAGVRRIEAITGNNVYKYLNSLEEEKTSLAGQLRVKADNITHKIEDLLNENKDLNNEIKSLNSIKENILIDELEKDMVEVNDIKLLVNKFEDMDMDQMRSISDKMKNKYDDLVIVFASINDGRVVFLSSIAKELTKRGLNAGQIVRYVAQLTGGNGGGRPDFASAGGKDIDKVDMALEKVRDFIEENLK